jgi:hypothetical protein
MHPKSMISGTLDSKLLRILELSISRFDFSLPANPEDGKGQRLPE